MYQVKSGQLHGRVKLFSCPGFPLPAEVSLLYLLKEVSAGLCFSLIPNLFSVRQYNWAVRHVLRTCCHRGVCPSDWAGVCTHPLVRARGLPLLRPVCTPPCWTAPSQGQSLTLGFRKIKILIFVFISATLSVGRIARSRIMSKGVCILNFGRNDQMAKLTLSF